MDAGFINFAETNFFLWFFFLAQGFYGNINSDSYVNITFGIKWQIVS
jgi:hypothetical protein